MTQSVNISLCHHVFQYWHKGYMSRVAIVAGKEAMNGSSNMDSLLLMKFLPSDCHCETFNLPTKETNAKPLKQDIP